MNNNNNNNSGVTPYRVSHIYGTNSSNETQGNSQGALPTNLTDEPTSTEPYEINECDEFDNMGLKENLLRGIFSYGFEKPSHIQKIGISPILKGKDIIAQSQSGTGKTATFTIGSLQVLDEKINKTQILVIAPVRELALQIKEVYENLGAFLNIRVASVIGGTNIRDSIEELSRNPHVVIGTPGRLYDMINKKRIDTRHIRLLVIDEADEMLSKGFEEQIKNIFHNLNTEIQVALFSATMTDYFFELTNSFMRDPVKILVKEDELTLEGIKQFYIYLERDYYKLEALCDLFDTLSVSQSILYCNSKKSVDYLKEKLLERNFSITSIHSGISQDERRDIMDRFRTGDIRMLISTDLLCRGIDVQQVSLVINYDIPFRIENYIHRIGRSGRYGRKGVAINFANERELKIIKELERYYSTSINELPQNVAELL